MGRSAKYKSPAKKMRSLRRLLSHFKQKSDSPKQKILSISQPIIIEIMPVTRTLSLSKPVLTNTPTNSHQTLSDMKPASYHQAANLLHKKLTSQQMPQLEGATDGQHCKICKKLIEDDHDYKWHFETEIGREDCRLLKSMLTYWMVFLYVIQIMSNNVMLSIYKSEWLLGVLNDNKRLVESTTIINSYTNHLF